MLRDGRVIYKPFQYPEAFDFFTKQQQSHWLPTEVSMGADIKDFHEKLSLAEKSAVTNVLRLFTQLEVNIEDYWSHNVTSWFPHPEIQQMACTFGAFEAIHIWAYSYLNDTLGLPVEEYSTFLDEPSMRHKVKRLDTVINNSKSDEDIARSLAVFSGFTEGVSLFSSFAILMNFSRFNKLRSLCQIISWSIRDECVSDDTEILTENGFVPIKDLDRTLKIAQYDVTSGGVTFVKPLRYVEHEVEEDLINFTSERNGYDLLVTQNHDVLAKWDYQPSYQKVKAKDLQLNPKVLTPVAGRLEGDENSLSLKERFLIAVQADGHISDRYTGVRSGTVPVDFSFAKKRKQDRLLHLLAELGLTYKTEMRAAEGNKKEQVKFCVNVPADWDLKKDFSNISLMGKSFIWCQEFIEELVQWDGYTPKTRGNYRYYSSVNEEAVNKAQIIATLAGYQAVKSKQIDNRKEAFNVVHRLYIHERDYKRTGQMSATKVPYKGKVYCVTVPTGAIIVRRNGKVAVTGNCLHSEAGCWLFRKFMEERPDLWTDDLKKTIYQAARDTVELEDAYIDKVFEKGEVEGLTAKQLKTYIRHRANTKLGDLGLKTNWKNLDKDELEQVTSWFDLLSAGVEHADFFASRVSSYSKGHINWGLLWGDVKK